MNFDWKYKSAEFVANELVVVVALSVDGIEHCTLEFRPPAETTFEELQTVVGAAVMARSRRVAQEVLRQKILATIPA